MVNMIGAESHESIQYISIPEAKVLSLEISL